MAAHKIYVLLAKWYISTKKCFNVLFYSGHYENYDHMLPYPFPVAAIKTTTIKKATKQTNKKAATTTNLSDFTLHKFIFLQIQWLDF